MGEEILLAVAIPVFMITMLFELWWIHRHKNKEQMIGYALKDTFASLSMGTGYLLLNALWKVVQLPIYSWVYSYRLSDIEPTFWSWVGIVLVLDFCYYWNHRCCHEVRLLWAGHVNHHSSQRYNLSTALRQSWTQYLTAFVFYIPILLLGFDPIMLVTTGLLHLFYQYWIHTEAIDRMGWLESILMTPSHHRVHHAVNPQYIDRNHGGLLILWDKLFGTFEPEKEKPIFGITDNIQSYNPLVIAFHEYKSIYGDLKSSGSIIEGFLYLIKPPGWQPESTVSQSNHIVEPSTNE